MESFVLIVSTLLVLGNTVQHTEASLFDPITHIFKQPPNEETPGKLINSILSPFHGNNDVQGHGLHHVKARNHRNPKAWWTLDSTPKAPLIQNIFNDLSTTTPDYDKIVAEQFPGATNLLEKLKELNKLKEEQKQKENGSGFGFVTTTRPPIFIQTDPNNNVNVEETTQKTTADGKLIMRALTKRRFYFQVQPIRPEDENIETLETAYYVDL